MSAQVRLWGSILLAALAIACDTHSDEKRTAFPTILIQRQDSPELRLDKRFRSEVLPVVRRDTPIRVIVDLVEQPDLVEISRWIEAEHPSRAARKAQTWRALEGIEARRSDFLAWLVEQPGVSDVRAYRCVNRVGFVGSEAVARAAVARPDVAHAWGRVLGSLGDGASRAIEGPPGPGRTWALDAMGARQAWAAGHRGAGVVVAVIDSGVTGAHPALAGRMIDAGTIDGGLVPDQPASIADDGYGHGSAVLAAAVGALDLGMAPEARWTAVNSIAGGVLDPEILAASIDWLLAVARPDVVVAPWDVPMDGPAEQLTLPIGALRVAGMAVVFPAGNTGPVAGVNLPPANLVGLAPDDVPAFSVGGVDESLAPYEFSCRGPNPRDGSLFPRVVAPAVNVSVLATPGGVRAGNGTSHAAGFAAGAAALLMSANPEMTGPQAERVLAATARDLGSPGGDNIFGFGLISVIDATRQVDAPRGPGLTPP